MFLVLGDLYKCSAIVYQVLQFVDEYCIQERCQSGRTGRSRKPLYRQLYRGFESHPLRLKPHFLTVKNLVKPNKYWY